MTHVPQLLCVARRFQALLIDAMSSYTPPRRSQRPSQCWRRMRSTLASTWPSIYPAIGRACGASSVGRWRGRWEVQASWADAKAKPAGGAAVRDPVVKTPPAIDPDNRFMSSAASTTSRQPAPVSHRLPVIERRLAQEAMAWLGPAWESRPHQQLGTRLNSPRRPTLPRPRRPRSMRLNEEDRRMRALQNRIAGEIQADAPLLDLWRHGGGSFTDLDMLDYTWRPDPSTARPRWSWWMMRGPTSTPRSSSWKGSSNVPDEDSRWQWHRRFSGTCGARHVANGMCRQRQRRPLMGPQPLWHRAGWPRRGRRAPGHCPRSGGSPAVSW